MEESGIVPVFYHPDAAVVGKIVKICYDEGMRVFEFTNRGDFAHEVFADIARQAVREFPEMILGVGSVVDGGTASLYIQLGANFIVSPVLKEDIAIVCNRRKIAWSPGCGSLNEISRAEELGAEIVKIFPGSSVGGPKFVAAIKGPCPWTSIMPTGGVESTEENLKAWFDAGVTCVGMGSNLFPKNLIADEKWDVIGRKVKDSLDILKKVRK